MINPYNIFWNCLCLLFCEKSLLHFFALICLFPKVCCHVAFKMTFVVKALSHWLQLLQRMYFRISCKFIWLIPRKCFEMQLKFIILWKNPFSIGCMAMVFPQCVSLCGVLYCSVLPKTVHYFTPRRNTK